MVLTLSIARTFSHRQKGLPDDSAEAWTEHRQRAQALHSELEQSADWRVVSWGLTDDEARTHELVEVVLAVAGVAGPYVALQFANHVVTLVADALLAPVKELISRLARRIRSGELGTVSLVLPDDTRITVSQPDAESGRVRVSAASTVSIDLGALADKSSGDSAAVSAERTKPEVSNASDAATPVAEDPTKTVRRYSLRMAYLLAFVYVAVVVGLVGLRSALDEDVKDLPWLLLIGLVAVLPAAIPFIVAAMHRVRPSLTAVKLGNMLEVQFRELHADTAGLGRIEEILPAAETSTILATGAPSMEETVASLRASRAEVLRIHLASGRKWRLRNLFLLVRAIAADTAVRQLVFVRDRDGSGNAFVGSCSPVALQDRFQRLRGYPEAARQLVQVSGMAAQLVVLDTALSGPESSGEVPVHAHPHSLEMVLGADLETASVEEPLEMTPGEYRRLLARREPFIAVTRNGEYRYTLSQERIVATVSQALAIEALRRAEDTGEAMA
jgi:hypothetical protein